MQKTGVEIKKNFKVPWIERMDVSKIMAFLVYFESFREKSCASGKLI